MSSIETKKKKAPASSPRGKADQVASSKTAPPSSFEPTDGCVRGVGKETEKVPKNTCIYSETERKRKIKKELKRLKKLLENVDETKKSVAQNLIEDAAFMYVTLDETKQIINRDGIIEEYQNGANQKGFKKSSAVEVYDKMVNTYSKVVKQLCEMLPAGESDDVAESILDFARRVR